MPRTPTSLGNGNIEWEETIEQPGGQNVYAKNVKLIGINGAPPSNQNPDWLTFENLSSTVNQNGTRIRPVRIEADPSKIVPGRTQNLEIVATNGRKTSSHFVDLEVLGVPRVDFELEYRRGIPPYDDVKNTVKLFLPQRKQTSFNEADFGFDLTTNVGFNVKNFTTANSTGNIDISTFNTTGAVTGVDIINTVPAGQVTVSTSTVTNIDIEETVPAGQVSTNNSTVTTINSGFPAPSNEAFPREIIIPNVESVDWNGSAVNLEWITTDSDVDHYNVYRSTSKTSGYTEISSSDITSMSYSDSGVNKDTTYYYRISSVTSGGTESSLSFPIKITTNAEILIDSFEEGSNVDFAKWDFSRGQLGETTQPEYSGTRAAGIRDSPANSLLLQKTLDSPRKPDRFRYRYWETNESTGGGFQLLNDSFNPEIRVATNNPQWEFQKIDDTTEEVFSGGDGNGNDVYEVWHEVLIKFDWQNGQFDYEWTRLSDGQTSTGTRDLGHSENIKTLQFRNYNSGYPGAGGTGCYMQLDDIHLLEDVNSEGTATIQINGEQVGGSDSLSSFPVYVNLADMPKSWWNSSTGAGSIQVFNGSGTEVPREVATYDSANQEGDLWFKADSIAPEDDTQFDIQADGSFSGSETNTWSDYEMVLHLNEDPSVTGPQFIDATGNSHDGSAVNSPTQTEGQTGEAIKFDSGENDRIRVPDSSGLNPATSDFTLQAAVNLNNSSSEIRGIAGKQSATSDSGAHYGLKTDGAQSFRFEVEDGDGDNAVAKFSTGDSLSGTPPWYRLTAVRSNTDEFRIYSDGIQQDAQLGGNSVDGPDNSEDFSIGKFGPNTSIDGIIDEVRFRIGTRDQGWLRTEHWNTKAPDGWYTVIS